MSKQPPATFDLNYFRHSKFINDHLGDVYSRVFGIDDLDITEVPLEKRLELTMRLLHSLMDEVMEVGNELPWKPWKSNYGDMDEVDIEAIREEIVDVQHFVNNLIMLWFDDIAQFHQMFNDKLSKNIRRQEEGY